MKRNLGSNLLKGCLIVVALGIASNIFLIIVSSMFNRSRSQGWSPTGALEDAVQMLLVLLLIGGGAVAVARVVRRLINGNAVDEQPDSHGTAGFASEREMQNLMRGFRAPIEPGALILAPFHKNRLDLPREVVSRHLLILGGTGSGKSRSFFLPNTGWTGSSASSLIATDPKGELWEYTSGVHMFQDGTSAARRYAPLEPDASECFNWIPLCIDARMSELCARALITSRGVGKDEFWAEAEIAFLSAVFSHAAATDEPTPLTAYRLFARQTPEQLRAQLMNSSSETAREQALVFYELTEKKVQGSVLPGIINKLQFMRDPKVQRFTSASYEPPDFSELRHWPLAVYWCLRESDIARLKPLTSLFFTLALEQLAGELAGSGMLPVTLHLDEFANVGRIPDFETTITLARGRGVACILGIQSLGQLEGLYGHANARTIIDNCQTKIILTGLDYDSAEKMSRALGDYTYVREQTSYNDVGGIFGGAQSKNITEVEHARRLLTADEVRRIGQNEQLVISTNRRPMWLTKFFFDTPPNSAQCGRLGPARSLDLVPLAQSKPMKLGERPPLPPELPAM